MSEQSQGAAAPAPMETSAAPWIQALRSSHDRLRAITEPLDEAQLGGQAYPKEWSIAQVLSHLGSGAEIFGMLVDAGLSGQQPPGREAFAPIWETWNGKAPGEQAADALRADGALVERLESAGPEQLAGLRLSMFGMDLDAAGLARMRLGEHALHTWDVAVALEPAATVAPDAVGLLIDTVDQLAARAGKAGGERLRLRVSTTGPERHFVLETGDKVSLSQEGGHGDAGLPELRMPAEALVRLVYGRLDPAHTPPVDGPQDDLDELRKVFPGF